MKLKKAVVFQTAFESYTSQETLGEGGSGRIFKAVDDNSAPWAIKLLPPDKVSKEKRKRFKNELMFCFKMEHCNIVKVSDYGVFRDDKGESPFYVMPLYSSSLEALLAAGIQPDKVLPYFAQMLDAVEAAHCRKVIHRDLKPANFLYDELSDRLVLADFGIAHFQEDDLYTTIKTAPATRLANFQYAAPEQHQRGALVDHRADLFALGLMLNEMFTGNVPRGTGYKTVGSLAPNYGYCDDLVDRLIRNDPAERPDSVEIIKKELIGRKTVFVLRQRLSEDKKKVIPATEVDDELISNPPTLVRIDWTDGVLSLILSRPVNDWWKITFRDMKNYRYTQNMKPSDVLFDGNRAQVRAADDEVQAWVDYVKEWIGLANKEYKATMERNQREAEEERREELRQNIEDGEKRLKVLQSTKI